MDKTRALAALGSTPLLQPELLRLALRANDRLKLSLTLLQAAADHARHPGQAAPLLADEVAAAGITDAAEAAWLTGLPAQARPAPDGTQLDDWPRLAQSLADDLGTMARPLPQQPETAPLNARVQRWQGLLREAMGPVLSDDALAALTHGQRGGSDSLHLTVMDLHRALNQLAAQLATEQVDGAQVWQLAEGPTDRERVAAFMHGLNRTRGLKLRHPGLDTAATRDGAHLLIQNDIGTNDAHVLVLQVSDDAVVLTYSDLHRQRFSFFQALLSEVGATWSATRSAQTAGLNQDQAYLLGTARFAAADEAALRAALTAIGARIVYLIDWNRARKRLQPFVSKAGAVAVLREAARRECGHMAWLQAGAERLAWGAMAAQGGGVFRLGDSLSDVLGEADAQAWLADLMALAWQAECRRQPVALLADEARWLLATRLGGRRQETDLLQEHAAYCHTLAQAVRDALAQGAHADAEAADKLVRRAKTWERQADELVERARTLAERHPQWQALASLVHQSDDVADALEEAAFLISLVADGHHRGWHGPVHAALLALADTVLNATQDLVRVLALVHPGASGPALRPPSPSQSLGAEGEAEPGAGAGAGGDEGGDRLALLWRVVQAERQADEQLRSARRTLAQHVEDAASLVLGNDLAATLEQATDALLALVHGVRRRLLATERGLS